MPTDQASPLSILATSLRRDYETWYAKSVRRLGFTYLGLQLLSLLAGFGAASIAALVTPAQYATWARVALVIIPAVGALASGILLQFRLQDLWRLREEGRIAFQDLALSAAHAAARTLSDAEVTLTLSNLRTRIAEIEADQSRRFFALSPRDFVARYQPPPAEPDDRRGAAPRVT